MRIVNLITKLFNIQAVSPSQGNTVFFFQMYNIPIFLLFCLAKYEIMLDYLNKNINNWTYYPVTYISRIIYEYLVSQTSRFSHEISIHFLLSYTITYIYFTFFSSNSTNFCHNIILPIKPLNVIHVNSIWIMVNHFIQIIWEISHNYVLCTRCCENASSQPRLSYLKTYKIMPIISTRLYCRRWLGLIEILVDVYAGLPRIWLIRRQDEFHPQIMRVNAPHGRVYSLIFLYHGFVKVSQRPMDGYLIS